ncbi:hypothetical protein [Carboxylicivirga taeanensis]|uniref:hypothetical protein n=1 Tax=Carboxylicivirga taeanensis TaxID=1416875 RepID=UPI003F6DC0B5
MKSLAQKVQQPKSDRAPQQARKQEDVPIDPTWNEPFDSEKLSEVWRHFTRQHEAHPRIHTIYKNHPPRVVQGTSLCISLLNKTQEHELNQQRSSIVAYLKRALRNAGIDITFEISQEEDKNAPRAFTVADKYKVMAEKNPALALFRKQFNLDLE